jgi:hypothetical protein
MKNIQFQYRKTPENPTNREAIVLSEPSNNYFTLDITEVESKERKELEAGLAKLQKEIDGAFSNRTKWLRDNGFGSYFRNFSKDKMSSIL